MTARLAVAYIDGPTTTYSEYGHHTLPDHLREQELARVIRAQQSRYADQGVDVRAADWADGWVVRDVDV